MKGRTSCAIVTFARGVARSAKAQHLWHCFGSSSTSRRIDKMAVKPPSPLHRRIEFCVEAHTAGSFYAEVARRSLASVGGISLFWGVLSATPYLHRKTKIPGHFGPQATQDGRLVPPAFRLKWRAPPKALHRLGFLGENRQDLSPNPCSTSSEVF